MNRATKLAIGLGGGALLLATAVDTLAVIGRHLGLPLRGSIELMQAIVLASGALGLVVATIDRSHAQVRLLVDRLGPARRAVVERVSDGLTLLFLLALLVGSAWISIDLWSAHERSELVGVPWRWLRTFANLCLLAACLLLVRRVFGRTRS